MKNSKNEMTKLDSSELSDPGNLLLLIYIAAMVCIVVLGVMWDVAAAMPAEEAGMSPENVQRGELLVALESGQLRPAPMLSQQVSMEVSGITARVKVEQHFVNRDKTWVEAVYVFPLPDESSVDHLRMRIGERELEGQIMEKQEARQTHEKAKEEGKKSSLLVQNRANIFTTRVANIGPGEEVTVEIEYQQTVRFADGIFSTRKGNVIKLEDLLNESVSRVRKVIEAKNPDLPETEKDLVAEKIGVGALKYADLSKNPQSMVIFDWDRMLSFEGNTAPYLQYTHARIKSVFRKAADNEVEVNDAELTLQDEVDRSLAMKLLQFPNVVMKAGETFKPNMIADYLFELGQKFNSYYANKPFLNADPAERNSRLVLAAKTADILKQGLDLLGIEAVERM